MKIRTFKLEDFLLSLDFSRYLGKCYGFFSFFKFVSTKDGEALEQVQYSLV